MPEGFPEDELFPEDDLFPGEGPEEGGEAMNQRSGLGAQIGFATETAYGTFKAPSRFLPFDSESINLAKEWVKGGGLQAGQMAQLRRLHKGTTRAAAGDVNLDFYDQGMGTFFNLLHGNVVAPEKIGTSAAYKQIHNIGTTPAFGKSATVQIGRSDTATGTVHPFSYVGGKLMAMKLSIDVNGLMTMVPTWDFQDEKTEEALAAATYDADAEPFTFEQVAALIGGEPFGNVLSMTVNVGVPKKTDRYFLGAGGRKAEPIENALMTVSGEVTIEFASLAAHQRYIKEEVVELAMKAEGATIGEGHNMLAAFKIAAAKQVTSGPQVSGPDVIQQSLTFEGLADGTHAPFVAELISTDSAL
jgi:hypothetical protein